MPTLEFPATIRPGVNDPDPMRQVVPSGSLTAIYDRSLDSYVALPDGIRPVWVYFDLPPADLASRATAIELVTLSRFTGTEQNFPQVEVITAVERPHRLDSTFGGSPIESSVPLDAALWPFVFTSFEGGGEPADPTKTAYAPRFQAPGAVAWYGSTLIVYYLAVRITYDDEVEVRRRVYPRDDRRNWPPPKAYSRGNRRGGGYL